MNYHKFNTLLISVGIRDYYCFFQKIVPLPEYVKKTKNLIESNCIRIYLIINIIIIRPLIFRYRPILAHFKRNKLINNNKFNPPTKRKIIFTINDLRSKGHLDTEYHR